MDGNRVSPWRTLLVGALVLVAVGLFLGGLLLSVRRSPVSRLSRAPVASAVEPPPSALAPDTAPVAEEAPHAVPVPEQQVPTKAVTAPPLQARVAPLKPRRPAPAPAVAEPPPVAREPRASDSAPVEDPLDKDFERELGFAKDSPRRTPEDPRSRRTVYLPPPPGQALPETLSSADILKVVGSHKDAIVGCIQAHAPPAEAGKGRFTMRWRVQTGGRASDVFMETESLRGTPFSRCMEDAVRSWAFPAHRVSNPEPVRFPFTY